MQCLIICSYNVIHPPKESKCIPSLLTSNEQKAHISDYIFNISAYNITELYHLVILIINRV